MKKILLFAFAFASFLNFAQTKTYFSSPDYSKTSNPKELSEFLYKYEKQFGKSFFAGKPNFAQHYEVNFVETSDERIGKMIDSETAIVYDLPKQHINCSDQKTPYKSPNFLLKSREITFESCNSEEKESYYYTYNWDETSKKFSLKQMSKELPESVKTVIDFNPDTNMDRTPAMLDKSPDETSLQIDNWINQTHQQNDESIDESSFFTNQLHELHNDLAGMDYDGGITEYDFIKKWGKIFDRKYLYWFHLSFDGTDYPNLLQLKGDYIGKLKDAYYYKMTFIDAENPTQTDWSPQNFGKIYKVQKIDGKFVVTGVFQEIYY